jgi:hypothetical protein
MKPLLIILLATIGSLLSMAAIAQNDNQALQAIVDRANQCANNAPRGSMTGCGVSMYTEIASQVPDRNPAKGPSLTLARRLTEVFSRVDQGQLQSESERQLALMAVMDDFRRDLQASRDSDRQRTLQMFRDAERVLTPPRQNTIECRTDLMGVTRCKY